MRQYWDPEMLAAVESVFDVIGKGRYDVDDVASRRRYSQHQEAAMQSGKEIPGVSIQEARATSYDGAQIPLVVYSPDNTPPGSVIVYLHGGGMIDGGRSMYEPYCVEYVAATGIPMVFPEYRLAPEHPDPTPVEDCFAAVRWTAANLELLGADADRIIIFGDSAGGGLAAGVALLARDRRGPRLAAQLLAYPMLDDRTVGSDTPLDDYQIWTYDDNVTGWHALLGDRFGTDDISIYAVPARAEDLTNLPRTYIDIGTIDIFREEAIDYAARLWAAGVSAELHVYPGAPHGFETMAPHARMSKEAISRRVTFLRSI